jgi:putative hydrolase of the HAD superfamily
VSAVRAVICDFGGVLTTPLFHGFAAYQERTGVAFERLGRALQALAERTGKHPLHELETGAISEEEFMRVLEQQVGEPLARISDTYFDHIHPNEPMIELMRSLRGRGLRMALLTNNVREWEPKWRAKLPDIDEIFETVVDSAFVGMRKPDPDIYELTVERLGDGLSAADCLFVDDTDVNCESARSLGMCAVHFRDNEQAIPEIEAILK